MISTRDALINGLGNNSSRLVIDKASIANAAAAQFHSLFRATGQPGQGAIPSTAAACSHGLTGTFNFTQQTAPATSYAAWASIACSNSAVTIELHDRLAHMGGLSGIVATAQTVGIDMNTLKSTANLEVRMGDANYSDIQWWLEWYTDTGGTAVTATVAVTYSDASTGNLTGISLAATRRASFMQPLNGLIPAAKSGLYIRSVDTVTLSATTGTAGSFGVTATRNRCDFPLPIANKKETFTWAETGMAEAANTSAMFLIELCSTTSTGTVRGSAKLAHG